MINQNKEEKSRLGPENSFDVCVTRILRCDKWLHSQTKNIYKLKRAREKEKEREREAFSAIFTFLFLYFSSPFITHAFWYWRKGTFCLIGCEDSWAIQISMAQIWHVHCLFKVKKKETYSIPSHTLYQPSQLSFSLSLSLSSLVLLSWAINWEAYTNMALSQYLLSELESVNLISILSTVLYILQTALLPMYSKLSDIYGRAACYSVAMLLYIISYIVMATSKTYTNLVVRFY